ncbi:MAG TPA: extracellular solute-binding protein, partial [bacterium]|nr:extracellular solute-binding protein [bacterium]
MQRRITSLGFGLALLAAACAPRHALAPGAPDPKIVRVYTSLYPEVIAALKPVVEAKSGEKVEFVQGGSERIAKRLDAELAAKGGSTADILLTSDPAYYERLGLAGVLVPYASSEAERFPAALLDSAHRFATSRISAMVIGISIDAAAAGTKPASFKELAKEKRAFKVALGDPDFSGTNLFTAARISQKLGWDYYRSLAARKALVAGSNSTVMLRLETSTSDVGIVLLENLLASRAKGNAIGIAYPGDGAVLIPGPIALLPHAKDSKRARAVYDAILSPEAQTVMVE